MTGGVAEIELDVPEFTGELPVLADACAAWRELHSDADAAFLFVFGQQRIKSGKTAVHCLRRSP